ncbi:iron-sulfur cluster-binding domain-containing protein [Pseudomonas sp. I3-I5]|uniref:iron-sulfur cluster-binding domain-containing protein n=1 Tax=Pseudomonas sp. I3-I5 TaxID=2926671 RepID=UPI001F623DC7|nr:iron-sulfur cluster-binding domain-containing protein [Pseudomonas sp. I3-I5]UNT14103.1 iron-sulfur cluster-binding domain-containing protein [Pseudomonas sp. I3-I5]
MSTPTGFEAVCEHVSSETAQIKVFGLRVLNASSAFLADLVPGRHVALQATDLSGARQQRLYSITRRLGNDQFELAIKREGRGGVSDQLHATCQPGTRFDVQFAAGDITLASVQACRHVGLLAGGIGITLPIALLRGLHERALRGLNVPQVSLLLCVPSIADIPFLHELLQLELSCPWFDLQVFVTREAVHGKGHFKAGRPQAQDLKALGNPDSVVICGSHGFAQGMREHLLALFPTCPLLIESFTPPAASAPATPDDAQAESPLRLHLQHNDQVLEPAAGKSLLEMLETSGIAVRSLCRAGICGHCRLKVSEGEYTVEPDFCLTDQDKRDGHALACCTFPKAGTIKVDLNPTA